MRAPNHKRRKPLFLPRAQALSSALNALRRRLPAMRLLLSAFVLRPSGAAPSTSDSTRSRHRCSLWQGRRWRRRRPAERSAHVVGAQNSFGDFNILTAGAVVLTIVASRPHATTRVVYGFSALNLTILRYPKLKRSCPGGVTGLVSTVSSVSFWGSGTLKIVSPPRNSPP